MTAVTAERGLDALGLGWLNDLQGSELYHKHMLVDRWGEEFWDEVVTRMAATTVFPRWLSEIMLDDYLAYLLARTKLDDLNEPLVATLLPDQAQHVLILYTLEWSRFCYDLAGEGNLIHHDPASESALVNLKEDIAKTVGVFERHGIGYHALLWQDHIRFPHGAEVIPTGVQARRAA